MGLLQHLTIHFAFSLLAGFVAWKLWRKPVFSFVSGIIGGFLIDFDHIFDYLIAFGFNFENFPAAEYTVVNDKIFYFFHGWEYAAIFLLLAIFIKKSLNARTIFLALALGIFFHLTADTFINSGMRPYGYSIGYRTINNFDIEKIVTEESYEKFLIKKQELKYLQQ